MIKTRKNVYETNSSSTHSITICSNAGYTSISPNENGEIEVLGVGEYGWNPDTFKSSETKLDYLSIYARDWSGNLSESFLEKIKNVVELHTGAKLTFNFIKQKYSQYSEYEYYLGNIDHQSVESSDYHYIFENDELIKDFIFGIGSILETDNDNY